MTMDELMDREAIRDCLYRYCRAIDRCDESLLRSVYWPDAVDYHGTFNGPADEFVAMVIPVLDKLEATSHGLMNILIEVQGAEARTESYFTAYHRERGGAAGSECLLGGRYVDVLQKRGGDWKIFHRQVIFDWLQPFGGQVLPQDGQLGPLTPSGGRGRHDPAFRHFRTHP